MRLTIVATKDRKPGKPEEIGDIDGEGLSFARGKGTLPYGPGDALRALLGDGYGDVHFHIAVHDRKVLLVNCTIDGEGLDGVRFSYLQAQPLEE